MLFVTIAGIEGAAGVTAVAYGVQAAVVGIVAGRLVGRRLVHRALVIRWVAYGVSLWFVAWSSGPLGVSSRCVLLAIASADAYLVVRRERPRLPLLGRYGDTA